MARPLSVKLLAWGMIVMLSSGTLDILLYPLLPQDAQATVFLIIFSVLFLGGLVVIALQGRKGRTK